MKVEIKPKAQPKAITEFPCLITYSDVPDLVIIATKVKNGSYVGMTVKGYYSEDWKPHNAILFDGEITLSND